MRDSRVVLELLKEEETAASIASRYGVTVQTLNQWKKRFLENATLAFDVGEANKEYRQRIEKLEQENEALAKTLGKTTVERDCPRTSSCGVVVTSFLGRAVGKLKSLDSLNKRRLVDSKLKNLPLTRQCQLLGLNRSGLYYCPKGVSEYDLSLMRRIDEIYTERATLGYRMIHRHLQEDGYRVGHNKVHRLMQRMGIAAIYPKRKRCTTRADREHKIYPYALEAFKNDEGQIIVDRPNRVWSGDITYIPVKGGFMYLAAIIDWHSRTILSWKLSTTMDTELTTSVLNEALVHHPKPKIFNTDQGSQYTAKAHIDILTQHGISISMDAKGRSIDNIVIERFWRTLKYEDVYPKSYTTLKEARAGIGEYIRTYNEQRLHSALDYRTPDEVYFGKLNTVDFNRERWLADAA